MFLMDGMKVKKVGMKLNYGCKRGRKESVASLHSFVPFSLPHHRRDKETRIAYIYGEIERQTDMLLHWKTFHV